MIRLAIALALFAAPLSHARPVELAILADCLALVESGARGDAAVGPAGEIGRYQLSLAVWIQHRPAAHFALARDPVTARVVALEHLTWLSRHIRAVEPTAYDLALAWNAGLTAAALGRLLPCHRNFAQRVANLYAEAAP
jgi:hypothetical protein